MITDRAPWDYENTAPIVSEPVKLCRSCCGNVSMRASGKVACLDCGGEKYVVVMEAEAAVFRVEIMLANMYVDDQRIYSANVRYTRELREEIEAEAADVRNWLGTDDRPSAAMREHRPG